jgi:hypothetical protein
MVSLGLSNNAKEYVLRMSSQVNAQSAIVCRDGAFMMQRMPANDLDGLTDIAKTRPEDLAREFLDSGLPPHSSST